MSPDSLFVRLRQQVVDAVRAKMVAVRHLIGAHPLGVTAHLTALFLAYAAVRLFAPLRAGTWPELSDSVIFEYIGWYLTEGNRLYLDVWEVKPPLPFEITAVLALLAGESVVRYHVLNLLANSGAVILAAVAAAGIVHELTDDPLGAIVGGVAIFTLPFYFHRALIGFKPKYFVIAAGLGCLYLAYQDRPAAAGVAGAAALGFWQLAVAFPIGGLGLCYQLGGRAGVKRFLAAASVTGAVVLLPVVLWGALPAMVAEVFLAPLLLTESPSLVDRMQFVLFLGEALPVALIGLVGIATGISPDRFRREWPLVLALGWFTIQIVVFDFDNLPDLFPWFAITVVGAGVAVSRRSAGEKPHEPDATVPYPALSRLLAVAILAMTVLSVGTMGGFVVGETTLTTLDTYDTETDLDPSLAGPGSYNATELQYLYWNRGEIGSCRAFGAANQLRLVKRLDLAKDGPWHAAPCGQFAPIWRAVRGVYLPLTAVRSTLDPLAGSRTEVR